MKKFIYRLKRVFEGKITWFFFRDLTLMDVGRWFFKIAHNCNRCGSLNVVGYGGGGLHCPNCRDIMCSSKIV